MGASGPGYVIEDRPEGRTLVVTGPWTIAAETALLRRGVDALWLNYARGYCEPDLSFVGEWPIKRLLVLDRSITDLSPLGRLGSTLEDLSLQAAPGASIDLTTLPRLGALAAAWNEIHATLYAPDYLSHLVVFDYDDADLYPLTVQPSLQEIQFKVAPRLETLNGIAGLPILTSLKIAAAPVLHDLGPISSADPTLRELDIESCSDVYDIDPLSTLVELRYLGISDCGRIASIEAIGKLAQLECLYAWGSNESKTPISRRYYGSPA
jgi:hypothetical protein